MAAEQVRRVKVASLDEVREGAGMVVRADEATLALFRIEGRCYAIANACPHKGGPLAEGDLEGAVVHCPWHGWAWNVTTGVNVRQPDRKVACYPVSVENGEVYVELESAPPTGGSGQIKE